MINEKDVCLTVRSVIENLTERGTSDGEPEITEIKVFGKISASSGGVTVKYREEAEGAATDTEILIKDGAVTVTRRGSIESEMRFQEGLTHTSLYSIPPYSFDTTVKTRRIRCAMTEDGGRLDIYYDMRIGGADKSVSMTVRTV